MKHQALFSSKIKVKKCRLQQTTVLNTFSLFSEKIRLDVSCESSARQRIHMKHQAIFSSKKNVPCCNFAWLFKV